MVKNLHLGAENLLFFINGPFGRFLFRQICNSQQKKKKKEVISADIILAT